MNDQTDSQLLRAYAERRSEPAFAELVRRHVDLVYSAAQRMVCDSHLAEDVTQGVFVALAKNASQLTDRPVLSGWLHRTAQNVAAQTVRTDVRRRAREQEAVAMNELLATEPAGVWEHIAPHLDAALGELSEADRDALLLRYFERKSAQEMAQVLGVSDEAAQKRVSRAVERLREFFAKRGVNIGASGLAVVISANAVQAAPVGLALTISTAAALTGTTLATTATVTATKAIAMTALQKTIVTATIAALAGVGIYEARQASQLREQNQALQQQQAPLAEQVQQLIRDGDAMTKQLVALRDENEQLRKDHSDLPRLRGEVRRLRADSQELAKLRATESQPDSPLLSVGGREAFLHQALKQFPERNIPELKFLTPGEWEILARDANLGTEIGLQKALSNARTLARSKLAPLMTEALKRYVGAHGGNLPDDLSQLKPYFERPDPHFESPVDDAILLQYKLRHTGKLEDTEDPTWLVLQKTRVEEILDPVYHLGTGGFGVALPAYGSAFDQAAQEFATANRGRMPSTFSQLLPYAKTPEFQAALQKLTEEPWRMSR